MRVTFTVTGSVEMPEESLVYTGMCQADISEEFAADNIREALDFCQIDSISTRGER